MSGTGVLALWKDCAEGKQHTFEHWYQTEHIAERLAVPGFLRCRRYESIDASSRFFTWYEVESPDVLKSDAYLERLDNPTPLTAEVMSTIMMNMSRTVCDRTVLSGDRFGGVAVTVKLGGDSAKEREGLCQLALELRTELNLARAELWVNGENLSETGVTEEERLRGGDDKMNTCLLLEFLRAKAAEEVSGIARSRFSNADVGVYRLLCEQTAV